MLGQWCSCPTAPWGSDACSSPLLQPDELGHGIRVVAPLRAYTDGLLCFMRRTLRENAMSVWELAAALVPTMVILVAGITLIEHLRVKGEGERYRHRESRADEEPCYCNGSRGEGRSGNGRTRRPGRK